MSGDKSSAGPGPTGPGPEGQVEHFHQTSGRVTGVVVVSVCGLLAGLAVVDPDAGVPGWLVAVALVLAVLAWSAMVRPSVSIVGEKLRLRGALSTVVVPMAAIEDVVVRQVLSVRAGPKVHTSAAVSRNRRQIRRDTRTPDSAELAELAERASYGRFVEERIRQRVDEVLEREGVERYSDAQQELAAEAQRRWAWPEIAALSAAVLAFVVVVVAG